MITHFQPKYECYKNVVIHDSSFVHFHSNNTAVSTAVWSRGGDGDGGGGFHKNRYICMYVSHSKYVHVCMSVCGCVCAVAEGGLHVEVRWRNFEIFRICLL